MTSRDTMDVEHRGGILASPRVDDDVVHSSPVPTPDHVGHPTGRRIEGDADHLADHEERPSTAAGDGDDGPLPTEVPTDAPSVPATLAAHLAALKALTDALTSFDLTQLDGATAAEVDAALSSAVSRLGAVDARVLPIIEADGLWATGGAQSFPKWVAARHRTRAYTAQEQVRLGRAMRDHLPHTAEAAVAGVISVEHANVLATLAPTTEQRRRSLADPDFACNEAWLIQEASGSRVDDFRRLVRHWAAGVDPDADDRGYVESSDREYLELAQVFDVYHLKGQLTVEHGQALAQVLRAVAPVPAAGDDRTASQRRAQALGDACRLVLDHGLTGTGRAVRPRIGVLVSHSTLVNLAERAAACQDGVPTDQLPSIAPGLTPETLAVAARFEDGTPVPRVLLDRLACDSEINRYVFGPDSEILDVGRAERTFTGPRRAAIIARDKHCRYPGCTAPPAISEGHHVKHWSRDHGETSAHNGILLCWYHHDYVHMRNIDIYRTSHGWAFERYGISIESRPTGMDGER